MGCTRFTSQQLFTLRNHIPIRKVIESFLDIPVKTNQDIFRFRCPLCAEYNTSINSCINLARCFHCEKNYNPIDMVMIVRHLNFAETVELLLSYKNNFLSDKKQSSKADHGPSGINQPLEERKPCMKLIPIKDILPQLFGENRNDPENLHDKKSNQNIPSAEDITRLEQTVESLLQQIKKLKSDHHYLTTT